MTIRIATAPVSWGVLMKDTPNVPPFSTVLDQIAEAGYTGTELGPYGYLPFDVAHLRRELAERGLTLTSAFTIFSFLHGEEDEVVFREAHETVEVLVALGCDHVVLSDALFADPQRAQRAGRIRPQDGLDEAKWDRAAANVEEFARQVFEEYGMRTAVHPHVGSYVETEAEIDALLARTNPTFVGLCFDMAHIAYGNGDPVGVLKRWRERTWYMHIKECDHVARAQVLDRKGDYFDGVQSGVFPELGQGTIDWKTIAATLAEVEYDGWGVVEQDILPDAGVDALASAKRNRAFLREQLGW